MYDKTENIDGARACVLCACRISAMEKQRATLVEAMARKAIAYGKLIGIDLHEEGDEAQRDAWKQGLHDLYVEIGKYADYADLKVSVTGTGNCVFSGQNLMHVCARSWRR